MRPTPLVMLSLAALLALSGAALAAKDPTHAKGNGHTAAPPPAPAPTPAPAPVPIPPSIALPPNAIAPASQPQIATTRSTVTTPLPETGAHYNLHAGFVGLESPPIEVATANVNGAAPGSPLAMWRWALPLIGLVGIGTVVMTTRRALAPSDRAGPQPILHIVSTDVRSLLEAGKAATARGALAEALAWFTQATRLDPTVHVAHFCRGVCLTGLGQHEDAYAAYLRALDLDASEGAYRLAFARASALTARTQEAMEALGPLLEAMPALAEDIVTDEAFAMLGDHPRFLAMTGRL